MSPLALNIASAFLGLCLLILHLKKSKLRAQWDRCVAGSLVFYLLYAAGQISAMLEIGMTWQIRASYISTSGFLCCNFLLYHRPNTKPAFVAIGCTLIIWIAALFTNLIVAGTQFNGEIVVRVSGQYYDLFRAYALALIVLTLFAALVSWRSFKASPRRCNQLRFATSGITPTYVAGAMIVAEHLGHVVPMKTAHHILPYTIVVYLIALTAANWFYLLPIIRLWKDKLTDVEQSILELIERVEDAIRAGQQDPDFAQVKANALVASTPSFISRTRRSSLLVISDKGELVSLEFFDLNQLAISRSTSLALKSMIEDLHNEMIIAPAGGLAAKQSGWSLFRFISPSTRG